MLIGRGVALMILAQELKNGKESIFVCTSRATRDQLFSAAPGSRDYLRIGESFLLPIPPFTQCAGTTCRALPDGARTNPQTLGTDITNSHFFCHGAVPIFTQPPCALPRPLHLVSFSLTEVLVNPLHARSLMSLHVSKNPSWGDQFKNTNQRGFKVQVIISVAFGLSAFFAFCVCTTPFCAC